MRRPPPTPGPFFKSTTWWDRLFWRWCYFCHHSFKGEPGWRGIGMYSHQGGLSRAYACTVCCPTIEDADEKWRAA